MSHEKFTQEELESKANDIMLRFDFEKVLAHMQSVNWCWQSGEELRVPTMDEVRALARSLLTQSIWHKSPVANVSSGGFHAYKLPWGLKLTFSITQSF